MSKIKNIITAIFVMAIFAVIIPAKSSTLLQLKRVDVGSGFPEIRIHMTADKSIPDLTTGNFIINEDGKRAGGLLLDKLEGKSGEKYLVIVIDSSRSVKKNFFVAAKKTASEIIENSTKGKFSLFRFNDRVYRLSGFSTKKDNLIERIDRIKRHGNKTVLYDAVYESIRYLGDESKGNKSIIVFTDGKDEGSRKDQKDVIRAAIEEGISINIIGPRKSGMIKITRDMAVETGGRVFGINQKADALGLCEPGSPASGHYVLSYKSGLPRDGKTHGIEIVYSSENRSDRLYSDVFIEKQGGILSMILDKSIIFYSIVVVLLASILLALIFLILSQKRIQGRILERDRVIPPALDYGLGNEEKTIVTEKPIPESDPEYTYANAWLIEKSGPSTGTKYPIYWDEITIGRGRDNSIVIEDEFVSFKHAKIRNEKSTFRIYDLASDNGTYLNSKKLLRPKTLYDWDEIKIGRTLFIFRGSKRPL